jgi:hypothetical protein
MQTSEKILKFASSIANHIIVALISICILSFFFHKKIKNLNITDPIPHHYKYTPKDLVTFQSAPTVKTGLFIRRFPAFDVRSNNFVMDALVWFEFNPHTVSLETLNNFSFENATIIKKSTATTKLVGSQSFAYYEVRLQFTNDLTYFHFPFEDHRLSLILTNQNIIPEELIFQSAPSHIQYPETLHTADWNMTSVNTINGYSRINLEKKIFNKTVTHPLIVFTFDFARAGSRKIIVIFIPLFLCFFLWLFSLIVEIHDTRNSIRLSLGSLSSMFAYRFVIENITPNVGYFTIADRMFAIYLSLLFFIFLINIYMVYEFYGGIHTKTQHKTYILSIIRCALFYLLTIAFIASTHYCLFY